MPIVWEQQEQYCSIKKDESGAKGKISTLPEQGL